MGRHRWARAPWWGLALLGVGCGEPLGDLPAAAELARLQGAHPALFAASSSSLVRPLRVVAPERADGVVELGLDSPDVWLRLERVGAAPSEARSLGAWRVYPGALGPDATLVTRATGAGYEERVALERPGELGELVYRLELAPALRSVRQVAGVLELVDASGAPRLRVMPPVWRTPDGARAELELELEGCAIERDPAPPWGRDLLAAGARECELRVSLTGLDATAGVLELRMGGTTELAVARRSFGLATLPGGLVLAAGGLSEALEPLASAELHHAPSGTWAAAEPLLAARSELSLSVLPGGEALAAGGRAAEALLASAELYDGETGRWRPAPPLPAPRAGHAAVVLDGGELLLAGGDGPREALRFAGRWTSAGELLAAEPGATLSALSGGRALLVGPEPPEAQLYEPASGWRALPSPAVPRSGHTATRLQSGRVLIAGGRTRAASGALEPTRAAEVFEPGTQTWQRVGATHAARVFHTATPLDAGRVLLAGGEGARGSELYDPAWGTWTPGPDAAARSRHGAARLPGGAVLLVGGASSGALPQGDVAELEGDAAAPAPRATEDEAALASVERLEVALPATVTAEYRLPARLDRSVTGAAVTELWAAVTRPGTLESGRRYPLILALAGNHATCGTGSAPRRDSDCSYTHTGTCPSGFGVVHSHRGFDYLAAELAARGHIVVSVNANRGINCGDGDGEDWSMNLARGRLLLRHLETLARFDRGDVSTPPSLGVSLEGRLDLSEVGLLGHSRGGEGARAALQQYRDPDSPWPARLGAPLVLRAIFELAPVDGQTPRRLDPDGVAWAALLPMCDGDVSDLQGIRPFDRMLRLAQESPVSPKATLTAWGANHNFFNTQWQVSDSTGCTGHRPLFDVEQRGSAEQRQVALGAVLEFFQGSLGAGAARRLGARFDPVAPWPSQTRVDRGFSVGVGPGHALPLEDFGGPSGVGARGLAHLSRGLRLVHSGIPEHDPSARAALVRWQEGSPEPRFFELRFAEPGSGLELGAYDYLELRAERAASPENPPEPTRLVVQLLGADDTLSPALELDAYGLILDGPVGGPSENLHSMLQTVRVPLADFGEGRAHAVRGVRFGVPGASGGALFVADVRATVDVARPPAAEVRLPASPRAAHALAAAPGPLPVTGTSGAPPRVLRAGGSVRALPTSGGDLELELGMAEPFEVGDDALVLELGGQHSARSRHPGGDLRRVVFRVDADAFSRASDGGPIRVRSSTRPGEVWDFGALDKAGLSRAAHR